MRLVLSGQMSLSLPMWIIVPTLGSERCLDIVRTQYAKIVNTLPMRGDQRGSACQQLGQEVSVLLYPRESLKTQPGLWSMQYTDHNTPDMATLLGSLLRMEKFSEDTLPELCLWKEGLTSR